METNRMVFLKDKDAFASRQPATVPIGAPPPPPPTSPLVYPPASLEVGHYTWRCTPGFRETIKETCDHFDECVKALYDQQLFIEKILKLGASHRQYGIRRKEIARFGDAVLDSLKMQLGSSLSKSAQKAWTTMLKLIIETRSTFPFS